MISTNQFPNSKPSYFFYSPLKNAKSLHIIKLSQSLISLKKDLFTSYRKLGFCIVLFPSVIKSQELSLQESMIEFLVRVYKLNEIHEYSTLESFFETNTP